ncbi:hypothetical protein SJC23_46 [Bacteroides phage SJC23]|nr:hypothetical protein SJC23_46 [Bacteroides phage SJC23]
MCLCSSCMEIAAQAFIYDTAERKLKESEKDVEGLSKAEYESMRELKDKLRKEIEADVEAKVRAAIEAKKRANRITEAEIKFANGTHEALRGKCSCCGKAVHPSLITRVHGKYGCEPYKLCPDCYKDYRRDKAEEAAQIKMADLSIENNRLRTRLKDLKEEYESFRERTSRVWWGVAIAGVLIGSLFTLMFLNPK